MAIQTPSYHQTAYYENHHYAKIMNPESSSFNNRVRDLDAAYASRYHPPHPPSLRYSPQRTSSSPTSYRTGYSPAPIPSHARSFSRPNSRPTSSHGETPPLAPPPPPPMSFISHIRHQRRRSSQSGPRDIPKVLSRRSKLWPPEGYSKHDLLHSSDAEKLIAKGASTFAGDVEEVTHSENKFRFFAVMRAETTGRTDRAVFQNAAFENITFSMTGRVDSAFPWMSLEQPSMATYFGKSPGTTTLTYFVGKSGSLQTQAQFGSKNKPRKMKLIAILERLKELESQGIDDENIERTYHMLYGKLIFDPEADTNPHYDRAMQIADLLTVLSNPDWIDFSLPKNQVVAKFFDSFEEKIKRKFFHQLLLSIELHLRIESPEHEEGAKRTLLAQVPPKVAWDLALAQRWLEHMSIEREHSSTTQSTFTFKLTSKNAQKEALRNFATLLKWPNMEELNYILEEKDKEEKSIEDRSADTMAWFTGVILPGTTLPWLLMNTLIDCDRDTGDELNHLSHMHPNSGFQYRANTYWSSQCIVGKVLGASRGVKQVAGWIGPCHYTPELERTQCVVVHQIKPFDQHLTVHDMDTISSRTSPLGPDAIEYPIEDYDLIIPDTSDVQDIIRIQKLSFNPYKPEIASTTGAKMFEAAIIFAFAEKSLPIKLRYNVDFINAYPCTGGPHPLYFEYKHRMVSVDGGLADLHNWGSHGASKKERRSRTSSPAVHEDRDLLSSTQALMIMSRSRSVSPQPAAARARTVGEVLVVEAFGVSDNEVFARAWCAHWGVSAVVANVRETCVACAVREARAACVSVVLLTEGGKEGEVE